MIVVFGSINIDLVTRATKIPGPGETVAGPIYEKIPGGKGANQALAARRAGADVVLVGAVGADDFATHALSLLKADGVDLHHVATVDQATGAAFITVDPQGENAIVVAAGANDYAQARQLADVAIDDKTVLLLQREVPDAEGEAAARLAKSKGARVILNLAPAGAISESYLRLLDVLIMNEHEAVSLAAALGLPADVRSDPESVARTIDQTYGVPCVVTLGANGAVGWTGGVCRAADAIKVKVVDTTAAGDTFAGAFAAALERGAHFSLALQYGIVAGGLACTKQGAQTSVPYARDIESVVQERLKEDFIPGTATPSP
ncbi:ribokinase [Methylovirgula sp. 4M-Z18]|uniref:ribokinase n=1 Tax=Methylovirgula sp. 4M-Z18 TaxID=2293567 RepID=UPI000E2EB5EC|nr:ribokinase [Methylovirgula sp. 4M-Z18]RFB81337.1 ribokinase [Methylovirgula sp. 4M-Z18]